jgi:2-haloalkanoic acid dehalogenase type II
MTGMSARYDIITFDCYGTLIDWERGMREAFAKVLARSGSAATPEEAVEIYGTIEPVVQSEEYRKYREVLDEAASRTLFALGITRPGTRTFLSDSLHAWPPFPDTNGGLERLRDAGVRLALLSNIDDDLLGATLAHFTVAFDFKITAQQVGSYKPAEGHFLAAREVIGDARWLHAAQSYFHDIIPARSLGIPTAWINRKDEDSLDEGFPDWEFGDLAELADHV